MNAASLLRDLTVVLLVGAAALLVFRRFKQPPVLGYLVAGLLLGPHTPPFPLVGDVQSLEALAEVGVVFLLFALGLEFNLGRLARSGLGAVLCALLEAGLLLGAGTVLARLAGRPPLEGLLFGGVVALSSTAIVARALMESERARRAPWAELVVGTLIAEDVVAVVLIAVFSSIGRIGEASWASALDVVVRFGALATLVLVTGLLLLPRLLSLVERSGVKEVRTLLVIGTCFGVSFLTHALGFSAALGAFLAGALVSESGGRRLHETAEPFKDVFGAVFFVAVGMMIEPAWAVANWQLAFGLAAGVFLLRMAANTAGLLAAGIGRISAVQAAVVKLPIGEFSFILAQVAQREGLVEGPLYPVAVLLCLATTASSSALLGPALDRPGAIDALFPKPAARVLDEYTAAVGRLAMPRRVRVVLDLTRPSLVQIFINVMVLTGLFLAAGWANRRWAIDESLPGAAWGLTALATLPFLLALWRKAQAVALILLEALVPPDEEGRPPAEARPRLTRFVLGLVTAAVAWWYLSVSLPVLPGGKSSWAAVAIIAGAGVVFWRAANRLYARIQANLRDTLARSHAEPETGPALVSHLVEQGAEVRVMTLRLGPGAKAGGRSIAELDLRAATGATLLQINRSAGTIPAPSPQTRLEAGDEVLLVGTQEQVDAARGLLGE
ncbi:MAG: monovalent cation:H+ antiporter-2, CPA2 family [Elusimicrobia bacterium]|nr:MAG: monovalent cation:H+ antiporter-2, CPA2 family [Elusimicrobiota bacterium]